jgi:hypothetical protein
MEEPPPSRKQLRKQRNKEKKRKEREDDEEEARRLGTELIPARHGWHADQDADAGRVDGSEECNDFGAEVVPAELDFGAEEADLDDLGAGEGMQEAEVFEKEGELSKYYEQVCELFSENGSLPPFMQQHPDNDVEFFAMPFPDWNGTNLTFKHMHIAGCARVRHGGDEPEGEEGDFVRFCTCSAKGLQVWHELQLFHNVSGGCTSCADCIHAETLQLICGHTNFSATHMMLFGRCLGKLSPRHTNVYTRTHARTNTQTHTESSDSHAS